MCVSNLKNARKPDKGVLVERPDVKIFLPFRFYFYKPEEVFQPNTYNRFLVAPGGDHLISLIDEISYVSPPAPMISQMHDIPPEQFCNGDNRPPDCGRNCMCTHTVDIPLNAIVEVVLVDEGNGINSIAFECLLFFVFLIYFLSSFLFHSSTNKFKSSVPFAWYIVSCYWYGSITRFEYKKN